MIEFVFDEARTVADLLLAGVFARYPDIRFGSVARSTRFDEA